MTEQKLTLPITMESKLQTRDGRKVTLYCVDAPGKFPIHGHVEGCSRPHAWYRSGSHTDLDDYGLIDAPKTVRVQGYLNVYDDGIHKIHATKGTADFYSASNRIACIEIDMEIEEGRFDD